MKTKTKYARQVEEYNILLERKEHYSKELYKFPRKERKLKHGEMCMIRHYENKIRNINKLLGVSI